ncbi:MAG: EamA family transporter [bacterium]
MSSTESNSFAALDWALLAITALIWGSSFLLISVAVAVMPPQSVAFLRLLFGVITLAMIPSARRPVPWSDWPAIGLVGLVWMTAPFVLFSMALQSIESSLAGMLNAAAPLFTAIIAAVFWKRQPGTRQRAGLLIGFVGVVVVSLPKVIGAHATALGVSLVLLATLLYGLALNLAAPLQQRYGALQVIWRAEVVALLLLAPLGIAGLRQASLSWASVTSVALLGVFGTAMAFVAFTTLVGRVGSTRASIAIYFLPPVAIALGALVRHEAIATMSVLGTGLVLVGAWLTSRAERTKPAVIDRAKAAAVVVALLAAPIVSAQSPTAVTPQDRQVSLALPRLRGTIVIDGRSDDEAWKNVPVLPMTVHRPTYGAAPTERTDVRVAYDDDALYVVIDAWESHAGGIRASTMIRDDDAPGDFVNILLDTFGDGQNAVSFSTTPGGNRNDFTVSNDALNWAALSNAWNGVWELATRREGDGWHAEFRIPFSTLRFSTTDGRVDFGLSINRLTAHSNERVTFPDIEPSTPTSLWKPSRMQRVSVDNIHPARSVRVTPYTIAGIEHARFPLRALSPLARQERFDMGGDLKMAVTPNLTLDLTANTDFAEAEVDDQRVNLTRFPLFFPERRPFFLERASTFELRTGESDLLFNSRRVGLTATGEPVRLIGGARLVGRIGDWDVGAFNAQSGRTPSGGGENMGVGRIRRSVLNDGSWVGVMLTSRVSADSSQMGLGADGEVRLRGDDYASLGFATLAGALGNSTDRGFLPRSSLRLLVERRRDRGMWYRAAASSVGARHAPALGYIERTDAVRGSGELGYGRLVTNAGHLLRGSVLSTMVNHNSAKTLDTRTLGGAIALDLPSGASWVLTATRQEDDLTVPFFPTPHTSVPTGRHRATFAQLSLTPSTGPRTVVGLTVRGGEFLDGTLYSLLLSPEWRASAHLRVSGDFQLDRLEFSSRAEREWSRLARLRILASASPRLSLSAVIQSNDLAEIVTANARIRYNVREGHDLWVVYGHYVNLDREATVPSVPMTARVGVLVKYARSFGT